jgi:methyl-accepting chemotaxis protein
MAWYPTRISTRLTIGGILLLAVTTIVIVVIMLWRGQPRVVEINTALIEETGQGLTRQLSTVLSRIEGETVSCRDWLKCCLTMNLCIKALFRI